MKVLTVVGARPQFIKAGPVSLALQAAGIRESVVHTGQHYDSAMSQVFFDELGLGAPDRNLEAGSGTHAEQTAKMLVGLERTMLEYTMLEHQPDWVLLYGDTNSTLAGALAASKLCLPIAHVEAGLRSFDRRMPEEINRVLVDTLSARLFAPSAAAVRNLAAEGVSGARVEEVGDVMVDALLLYRERAKARSRILESLALVPGSYVLVTLHRAENTDDPERLANLLSGVARIAENHVVVWPVHPRARKALQTWPGAGQPSGLRLMEPVGYLDMTLLTASAAVVLTDSGGLQKEAFLHRVPCVTARDSTEWVETVELGWNRLAPPRSAAEVVEAVEAAWGSTGEIGQPYGDGAAARRIAESLLRY